MNESDYKKNPIKNEQFHEGLDLLEKKLNKAGLKYLKYLNNAPEVVGSNLPNTLEYASKIDSEIDVIIFKVGPATGWDIPRANMLLQLRNVSSEALNIQTIGRIMRNPYKNLEKNEVTNKYYVWSNYQEPSRDESSYKLKERFEDENFISGRIDTNNRKIREDNFNYREDVIKFIKSPDFINKLKDLNPNKDIIYNTINYGTCSVSHLIPNHIYLKIHNIKIGNEMENNLQLSLFKDQLKDVSESEKINIEIVRYVFLSCSPRLNKIKEDNNKWIYDSEPYTLINDAKTKKYYSLWKDNNNPKLVDTSDFKNYGYIQITGKKNIQFLDSTPEMEFYKKFSNVISSEQRKKISFFAKMPTLGSEVYFDYYSKIQGKITKSYMDFAIKYNEKIIMIEVKSKDQDYNEEKTKELLDTYEIYMQKFHDKNISLVLHQYDKSNNVNFINAYIDNKWRSNLSFRDLFDNLFK